jgi:WD40 repeat protein
VAISPDNHWLAAGSAYGDFFIWDLTALPSRVPMLVRGRFGNNSHAAVFSPDSKRLAVAGSAGSVDLFELANGTFQERGLLPGVDQKVHALAFAPDAKTLALSGLDDGTVRLFDVTVKPPRPINTLLSTEPEDPKLQAIGLEPRLDAPAGHRWPPLRVGSVAFAPDGKSLLALDVTGRVRLWDLSAKSPVDRGLLEVRQHDLEARGRPYPGLGAGSDRDLPMVAFSPNGALIAAAQQNGYVRLWNRTPPKPRERGVFAAHRNNVSVLAFSPDSKTLFTGGSDHLIRRWDLAPKTPVETPESRGPIGGLGAIAFSADGSRLAVTDDEYTRIWNLTNARSESRLPAPRTTIPVGLTRALAFSPNGKNLVIGEEWAMPPSIWDISGATPVRTMSLHPSPPVTGLYREVSVSFAADGHTMALGSTEPMIQVWDMLANPPRPRHVLRADDPETAHIVALSADGAYLAFSDSKGAVRIWLLTGIKPSEQAKLKGNGSRIWSLKFSPDGKTLAMGSNGRMRLVKISGTEFEWLHPSTNPLGFRSPVDIDRSFGFSTAFSRDGKRLIAADQISSNDGRSAAEHALCVYDIAGGKRLHEWHLPAPCWAIALAPDDVHVAAAMQNGVTYIFRIPESTGKGQGPRS